MDKLSKSWAALIKATMSQMYTPCCASVRNSRTGAHNESKGCIPSPTGLHLGPMKRIPWKLLLWLVGLGPLLGLAGLVGLARMGDLPETEALANPKTDFATRV